MAERNKTAEAAAPDGVRELYEKTQELLRKTFVGNEPLLRAMSNVMLGVCESASEKGLLKATFVDPEVFRVVKARFLPSLADAMTLAQAKDEWVGIELDISGKPEYTVQQMVGYKARLIAMMRQGVELLRNPDGTPVDLSVDETLAGDPMGTKVMARAQYIMNVNQQITFIWIAANQAKAEDKPTPGGKKPVNETNPTGMPGKR